MKPTYTLAALLFAAALCFAACNNAGKNNSSQTATEAPTPAADGSTTLWAAVDELRVRETPTADGKVITTIAEGTSIKSTGKTSDEKITVELRGQKVTDAFYEVTTAKGQHGWVFAGAVSRIPVTATNTNADAWLVTNTQVGKIKRTTTLTELIKIFGEENIADEKEVYVNGDVPPTKGVSIFKGKPDEINIGWIVGLESKEIDFVTIAGKGGRWHTSQGIKVGTTMLDIVKLNGQRIDFSGFDWDYGGYIGDFNKGKLDGTFINLRLGHARELPSKYSGDVKLNSDMPELKRANIAIDEMILAFGRPD